MRNRYVLAALVAMMAVSMVCADDLEPPWGVRTFIAPATDGSFTQNMSVVRKQWVCPICGYSTHVAPYSAAPTNYDECPDPWGLGHPISKLRLATAEERLCGYVESPSGTTLIGRPFHPGEPDSMSAADWDDSPSPWAAPTATNASSYVHVRAAGIFSGAHTSGAPTAYLMDPMSVSKKARFLVIEPGAVRAMATAVDLTEVNDPDAVATASEWTIHVNPYRVSNGDTWYVRQHEETNNAGRPRVVTIEVYSKLYGLEFTLDSTTDMNNGQLNQFRNDPGCNIISDSGAVRIECPRMLTGPNESSTYVMSFTIRSNTQTLPSPEEVDYDDVAGCGDLYAGLAEPDPGTTINDAFPAKQAWMLPTNPAGIAGYVGTDLDVAEKTNGSFTTDQCWPYRIPSGAVGTGKVMLQWSDGSGGALQSHVPGTNTYYREGGEWYYHADLWLNNSPTHPDMYQPGGGGQLTWEGVAVGNADIAAIAPVAIGDRAYYYMIDCSFLSTRPDVPLTGDTWATSGTAIETDTDAGSGGYTRVIVAEGADPAAASTVGGEYNPGSRTPDRPFYLANRVAEPTLVSPLRMGGSGARFRDQAYSGNVNDPQEGDPDPLSMFALRCDNCGDLYNSVTNNPGDLCPVACGGNLEWPVTLERVDADSQVAYSPLEALLVNFPAEGRRITLSSEAIRFGPDNSTVPVGVDNLLQTVRVNIPKYQPPSVPAGAIAIENDLTNDTPYVGSVLAYTRHVGDPALVFTDGFETHASGWTQYTGNIPYSLRGALALEDAGGNGTGTRTSVDYAVANTRYTWRAMPQYIAGSGPGQVYFVLADGAVVAGSESLPADGIWTRFTGYSTQVGGDLGAAGGWSVEVREGSAVTWSAHYEDLNTNADGLDNRSDNWYDFAIEIGPDLKPKFYYGDRLLGTSDEALGSADDHSVVLCTRSGNSLVDYVNAESLTSVKALERDAQWQTYYVSPNDGDKIPAGLAARMRSGQAGATDAPVASEYYCSVSDIRYSQLLAPEGDVCEFSGQALVAADILPEETLTAEEYDVFDLLVSVLRKAEVASDQRTVDLGWVAPGVAAANPTTTAGVLRAGSSSQPGDESSREDLTLRNEGNVPVASTMRAGFMFRPEIDGANRSRARWGQSVPSSLGTLFRYRPATPNDVAFTGAGLPLLRQDSDGAAGMEATARLQAGVRAAAGDPYGARTMPVPMGQPVGNYTGEMLVFIDLDADGHLDFLDADTGVTTTASEPFDPEADEPYEPVASFATRMRVVETRLPQNDYYTKDVSPTGIYDVSQDAMQILWAGTRVSAPGATAGTAVASGASTADAASPTSPFNILYANAMLNASAEAATDPYYRGWLWEAGDAKALSSDSAGTNNTAPVAYVDSNNNQRWAMWHRQATSAAGTASELRFDSSASTDWTGSSMTEFIYGTNGAKQGLTGFVRAGAANNHWLFWQGGARGSEIIRYRWDFDPTAALVNDNEAALPVSNAVARGSLEDATYEEVLTCAVCSVWHDPQVFDLGDACTITGCGGSLAAGDSHGHKKPAHYPFTYTKDPSVFERTSGGRPFVHAFFSGLVRATGNADICWVRFNEARMQDLAANYGKAAFPEVADNDLYMPAVGYAAGVPDRWAGEQLRPATAGRRTFQARGMDWMISDDTQDDPADGDTTNFATEPDVTPRWAGGYGDPELFVGIVTNAGGALAPTVYRLTWTEGTYERATGTYIVTPMLTEIGPAGDVDIAMPPGHPHANHVNELLEPSTRMNVLPAMPIEEWPSVRLRINPASGTVTWSAPLFNPDAPADPRAIFNTNYDPDILDVLMYANYTPYVYRVTTDGANDDSPSAFYDLGDSSRLTVFWRRSFGTADTPHFGRAAFMHKTYTTALQVGQPPIDTGAAITLTDLNAAGTVPYAVDGPNGIITITDDSRVGNLIRVSYSSQGAVGAQTEVHRIVGWSTETPVPVNSVVSEGRLRVVPEIYQIPDGLGGAGLVDVVRYWLLWSSPRASYDVRVAGSDGQNIKQSSDVYCAVVSPEYGSLIREADVPRVGP